MIELGHPTWKVTLPKKSTNIDENDASSLQRKKKNGTTEIEPNNKKIAVNRKEKPAGNV